MEKGHYTKMSGISRGHFGIENAWRAEIRWQKAILVTPHRKRLPDPKFDQTLWVVINEPVMEKCTTLDGSKIVETEPVAYLSNWLNHIEQPIVLLAEMVELQADFLPHVPLYKLNGPKVWSGVSKIWDEAPWSYDV